MENKMVRLRRLVKEFLIWVVLFWLVMTLMDWWREPREPKDLPQTSWTLQNGEMLNPAQWSSEQTGVVYFWATWCGFCRHTSPVVERLRADGVPVVGVALQSGSPAQVAAYMQAHDLGFDNVNDADGRYAADWGVAATPTVVLLRNGRMVHHTTGLSSYWGLRVRMAWADWVAD